ncbi:hypothetical protein [Klebsiella pneumoniae]|uniref:hypothetical protein n=1 Tax=Klebsiella pneumoniae TaxID=573 RepID=UPI001083C677|nr:hypothetical protein [Klebsiella pneumoniae]VGC07351.1 Uncharacterised protein [Klebsiella pneumoniae]HCI6908613.1 hypothetical protein [Klebsiella pneumoniae]
MTDITELAQSLKAAANTTSDAIDRLKAFPGDELIDLSQHEGEQVDIDITMINEWYELSSPANILALLEALEKAQSKIIELQQGYEIDPRTHEIIDLQERIAELESRTVKLPNGWQFEECEIEGCENGAIFSVGTGSRNIHLCDKCTHESQNSRLKKSPLPKRLPLKMSAGIKVEAE